jgi:hypothetical protein
MYSNGVPSDIGSEVNQVSLIFGLPLATWLTIKLGLRSPIGARFIVRQIWFHLKAQWVQPEQTAPNSPHSFVCHANLHKPTCFKANVCLTWFWSYY